MLLFTLNHSPMRFLNALNPQKYLHICFFIATLTFCFADAYAQNMRLDTAKAASFYQKGRHFLSKRPDSAAFFLQTAAEIYTGYRLDREGGNAHYHLGLAHQFMRNSQEALDCFMKSLAQYGRFYGEQDPEVANAYNSVGNAQKELGLYDNALLSYQKALEIRKNFFDPQHPKVASVFNNIGNILSMQRKYNEAIAEYQAAVTILEAQTKLKDAELVLCYSNLALTYLKVLDYRNAELQYNKLLLFQKKLSGLQSLPTADAYDQLGHFYSQRFNYKNALIYFDSAYQIRRSLEQMGRMTLTTSYTNLGITHLNLEAYKKAKSFFDKADVLNKTLRPQDLSAQYADLLNYANFYQVMQDYKKALDYYDKILNLFLTKNPSRLNDISFIYLNMASLAYQDKDYSKSLQYSERALSFVRPNFEINALSIADILVVKGTALMDFGLLDSASLVLGEAEAIMAAKLDPTHDKRLQLEVLSAQLLLAQKLPVKCLKKLEDAFERCVKQDLWAQNSQQVPNQIFVYDLLTLCYRAIVQQTDTKDKNEEINLWNSRKVQIYNKLQILHQANSYWATSIQKARFADQRTQTEQLLNTFLK